MSKTKYLCPLCKKESAYISEYGMADSVICKCQGLNEVGRLVNGKYVPNISASGNNHSVPTPPPITNKSESISINPPYMNQSLPKGNSNKPVVQSQFLNSTDFHIYHLTVDSEVEAAGRYFNNALSSPAGRQRYMQMGNIYYAEHKTDENKSLMFYIDKQTNEAVNFYGKNNASPLLPEIDQVKDALRKQNLIKN